MLTHPPTLEQERKTVAGAHRRIDALEEQVRQHALRGTEHTVALKQLTDAITKFEDTMNKVVVDSEHGREVFDRLATAFLKVKSGEYLRLIIWGLIVSCPTWGPAIYRATH